ncbi:helix-hairpin-helix domain-containing protein [Salinibacterium hongtaonis]|uniref:helix-hairpin-helix domain-containing protein n=1 Tax=Homoserinimonas hongtaonis TaxID=2079791 RepID=UPI001F53FD38|nr:helix-hairpin-helix domain-containing protein [Salinibacterium hongtaonis]
MGLPERAADGQYSRVSNGVVPGGIGALTSAPPRVKVRLGIVIVLALLGVSAMVLASAFGAAGETQTVVDQPPSASSSSSAVVVYVHVVGAVAAPGLYRLNDGARGVDAVAAAGGFSADADRSQLNLARPVSDGEQIYVPSVGETAVPPAASAAGGSSGGSGLVNVNTADTAALETLPRIGPAVAQRIIDWRDTNGRFATVDDLLAVPGIGEKTLDGFRSLVTV